MTSLTGSSPERPKVPASRVVVKARIPQLSKSGITSFGTPLTLVAAVVNARDRSAERVQSLVNPLVAALDLPDVVDEARALGAKRGKEHCHSRSDVGLCEECAAQPRRSGDERAVRIAKDDSRAHRREFVDEEHAGLEH